MSAQRSQVTRLRRSTRWLLLAALLGAVFALGTAPHPFATAQQGAPPEAYTNDTIFEELSGAKRSLLELQYGKKIPAGASAQKRAAGASTGGGVASSSRRAGAVPSRARHAGAPVTDNPLVNDPSEDTTAQDTQSETTIVLGSGLNAISAFNDSGSFIGGAKKFTGQSSSADGGTTWTDHGTLPTNPFGDAGDPVLAYDTVSGNLYLATLSFTTLNAIPIFTSTDQGVTFGVPVNGDPGFAGGNLDKEWLAVDNFAGAGQGNVYLLVRDFGSGNGIYFTESTDLGATWGPSGGTLLFSGAGGNVQGAYVAVGPDHSLYAFAYVSGAPATIQVRKSTDFGATWAPAVTVTTLASTGVNGDLGLGAFRTSSFPHAAVNPVTGDVYVVYNNKNGTDHGDIYLVQSTDGGTSWSAPLRVNNDTGTNDQWQPTLAVRPDGAELGVSWYDRGDDPGNSLITRYAGLVSITSSTLSVLGNLPISTVAFPVVVGVDPVINSVYMGDYDMMAADSYGYYFTWGDNRDLSTFPGATRHNANVRSAFVYACVGDPSCVLPSRPPLVSGLSPASATAGDPSFTLTVNGSGFTSSAVVQFNGADRPTTFIDSTQVTAAIPDTDIAVAGSFPVTVTNDVGGTPSNAKNFIVSPFGTTTFVFDNTTPVPIPDVGTIMSPIAVSGTSDPIVQVIVSLYTTHTYDSDLIFTLIGPDSTAVPLSVRHGGSGHDYGTSCANRTIFDDTAATPIGSGTPPFAGTYKPDSPLTAFNTKSGAAVNGTWNLKVEDVAAIDVGTLQCWGLTIVTAP